MRSTPSAVSLYVKAIEKSLLSSLRLHVLGFELIQELKDIWQSFLTITVTLLINKP